MGTWRTFNSWPGWLRASLQKHALTVMYVRDRASLPSFAESTGVDYRYALARKY